MKKRILLVLVLIFLNLLKVTIVFAGETPATIKAGALSEKQEKVIKAAAEQWKENGAAKGATIGVLANVNQETGFDPFLVQGGLSPSSIKGTADALKSGQGPAGGLYQMESPPEWGGGGNGRFHTMYDDIVKQGAENDTDPTTATKIQTKWIHEEQKDGQQFNLYFANPTPGSFLSQGRDYGYKAAGLFDNPPKTYEEFLQLEDPRKAAAIYNVFAVRSNPEMNDISTDGTNHFRVSAAEALAESKYADWIESGTVSSSKSGNSGDSVSIADGALPEEWELIGMSKRNYLYENQLPIELPKEGELSINQQLNASNIQEAVDSQSFSFIKFIRTFVAFVGIWFIVYAIVLLIAYVFDRNNILFEFSFVSILTLGRVSVLYLDDESSRGSSFSTIMKMIIISLVIGLILITGTVYVGLSVLF